MYVCKTLYYGCSYLKIIILLSMDGTFQNKVEQSRWEEFQRYHISAKLSSARHIVGITEGSPATNCLDTLNLESHGGQDLDMLNPMWCCTSQANVTTGWHSSYSLCHNTNETCTPQHLQKWQSADLTAPVLSLLPGSCKPNSKATSCLFSFLVVPHQPGATGHWWNDW